VIAVCFKGGTNLNAWLVQQGWAVAFRKYGTDYIPQEDEARLARRGMWVGAFEMPWDWRARNQ
jgi:endonuclease YncB( thermonuclease family)